MSNSVEESSSAQIKEVKIDASTFLLEDSDDEAKSFSEKNHTEEVAEEEEDYGTEEEEVTETQQETVQKITQNLENLNNRPDLSDIESMSGGGDEDDDEEDDADVIDMTDDQLYQVLSGVLVDDDGNNVCDNILKIANGIDKHNDLLEKLVGEVAKSNKHKESEASSVKALAETMRTQNAILEKIVSSFKGFLDEQDESDADVEEEVVEEKKNTPVVNVSKNTEKRFPMVGRQQDERRRKQQPFVEKQMAE